MLQGLDTTGFHGHAEHGLLPSNSAHLVFLCGLPDHNDQLVGNDGVQDRDDGHWEHKGDESVDL